jgi:N-acetylmuramoyl-L-alanine amidase-like protein
MEFGVPEDLLLAVSHARSYWQHDGGVPDKLGFRGAMGLDGEALTSASTILGVPVDSVAIVPRHNIRGYAALLRAEFIRVHGAARYPERSRLISDWAVPVHQASGYHTPEAKGIYIRLVNRYLMRRGIVTGPQWSTLEHSRIQPHSGEAFCFDANEQPDYYCLTDDFVPAHPDNWRTRKNCTEGSPACEGLDLEPILHVVIHTSQSNTYQGVLDHFALEDQYWVDKDGKLHPSNVSAHYVVGFEGEIGQSVCEKDDANHIGSRITRNGELIEARRISIGIEHQGKVESGPFPTTAQYQTTAGLVRYPEFPRFCGHIVKHHSSASRTLPG